MALPPRGTRSLLLRLKESPSQLCKGHNSAGMCRGILTSGWNDRFKSTIQSRDEDLNSEVGLGATGGRKKGW